MQQLNIRLKSISWVTNIISGIPWNILRLFAPGCIHPCVVRTNLHRPPSYFPDFVQVLIRARKATSPFYRKRPKFCRNIIDWNISTLFNSKVSVTTPRKRLPALYPFFRNICISIINIIFHYWNTVTIQPFSGSKSQHKPSFICCSSETRESSNLFAKIIHFISIYIPFRNGLKVFIKQPFPFYNYNLIPRLHWRYTNLFCWFPFRIIKRRFLPAFVC